TRFSRDWSSDVCSSDLGGRAAGKRADHPAVGTADWKRAGDALCRQMIHQPEEERQIARCHPLLVKGQDEGAAGGVEQEVRVLRRSEERRVGKEYRYRW